MTKKRIAIAVITAVVSVTLVFGFASFMMSQARVWAAEGRPLAEPVRAAVNTASFVQRSKPLVVLVLIAGSVAVACLPQRLLHRGDRAD